MDRRLVENTEKSSGRVFVAENGVVPIDYCPDRKDIKNNCCCGTEKNYYQKDITNISKNVK